MRDDSEKSAALIRARIGADPLDAGLVLGASLAALDSHITAPVSFKYEELPGFMRPRQDDKISDCAVGTLGNARVAVLKGRALYHEAGDIAGMRVALETLRLLGAKVVVLNAAVGSTRREISPGALVAIRDHINLTGIKPLVGIDDPHRSVDLTAAYDPHLRERFAQAAAETGRKSQEGTLMWFPGPGFETPAEINAARLLGADLVGMSIVPEVILARHCGLRVAALSAITNLGEGMGGPPPSHAHTLAVAAEAAKDLERLIMAFAEGF